MNISLLALILVFLLIAIRQVGNIRVQIWQAMLLGAAIVVLTGQISPPGSLKAINIDVMLFLFGMFVIGQGLEESGYLSRLSYRYFKRAKSRDALLVMILFGAGISSALVMNDTLAIIGTPVVLVLSRKHQMSPKLFLLALAFGVTIGSVMSPIGNPQNLLIALNGNIPNPFVTFLRWLLVPTVLNLYLTYLILKKFYPDDFHDAELVHSQEPIRNHELAHLSRISLQIVLLLVVVKIATAVIAYPINLHLTHIALAGCLPILVGSRKRWHIIKHIDWHTLVFFAAMFVLMESAWRSGFFQFVIREMHVNIASLEMILAISVVLSQFVSNVPLVALYQPMLTHAGAGLPELMALAAASTIAGNLFILGAASNIIVIQNAERRSKETITFWEFTRIGIPLTAVNMLVYWAWLRFV
ncbi:MAG: anion transporter [Bacteroidetes bacterium]|nr:anion transporter [Bacteroidota bacterium]MCW5896649.1 anion transporter [Bacteroidota bacterium]